MLLLQGSLFMTRYHINRWWTLFVEFFMVIHGTTVAYFALEGLEARCDPEEARRSGSDPTSRR